MYFNILNQHMVAHVLPKFSNTKMKDYILISITSTRDQHPIINDLGEKCKGILKVKFDDTSYPSQPSMAMYDYKPKAITDDIAEKIVDFFMKYKEKVDVVVINCQAGWSRSPGTALGLHEIANPGQDPESKIMVETGVGLRYANKLVRDKIIKVYNEKYKNS